MSNLRDIYNIANAYPSHSPMFSDMEAVAAILEAVYFMATGKFDMNQHVDIVVGHGGIHIHGLHVAEPDEHTSTEVYKADGLVSDYDHISIMIESIVLTLGKEYGLAIRKDRGDGHYIIMSSTREKPTPVDVTFNIKGVGLDPRITEDIGAYTQINVRVRPTIF